ncbi:MAG: hypothetical protein WAU01_12450, partial [Saprospiraceae bacterium]
MTRTKKYLIAIGSFLLLIMILSLFLSNEYTSNSSTEINAPANFVYNAINDLDHHRSFNPKAIKDTSFQMMFVGTKIGTDASCDYTGRTTDPGVMQIKESNGVDSIMIIDHPNGQKQKKYIFRMVAKDSTHTTVSIEASSESGFITNLWNVIHRWKLKKESGRYLDHLNLFVKDRYENKVYHGYQVREMAINRKFYIGHRSEVAIENVSQFYSQNIAALYQKALNSNIVIAGMPCA